MRRRKRRDEVRERMMMVQIVCGIRRPRRIPVRGEGGGSEVWVG